MFIMHISALLAYSVLLASTTLIIWSLRHEGAGSALGKFVGSFVFILSLLSMLCIGYYGLKYWTQGHFETPPSMPMEMRQDMMQKMMPQMMEKMMEHMGQMGQMGQMGNMGMQKGENHSHSHISQ
ncbi:MAG: hypothetical protein K2Y08_02055 [Alphaproteobacteria bacterium]|nr:hypothetical protein [Alphaproteobacteria bacterium]